MKVVMSEREGFAAFVLRMQALGLSDQRLISAFEATPRMAFVNGNLGNVAYGAGTLPIECGEFIEALDLQAQLINSLDLEPTHRVLEIGTFRATNGTWPGGGASAEPGHQVLLDRGRAALRPGTVGCRQGYARSARLTRPHARDPNRMGTHRSTCPWAPPVAGGVHK